MVITAKPRIPGQQIFGSVNINSLETELQ